MSLLSRVHLKKHYINFGHEKSFSISALQKEIFTLNNLRLLKTKALQYFGQAQNDKIVVFSFIEMMHFQACAHQIETNKTSHQTSLDKTRVNFINDL
jgi:hypothetical protein